MSCYGQREQGHVMLQDSERRNRCIGRLSLGISRFSCVKTCQRASRGGVGEAQMIGARGMWEKNKTSSLWRFREVFPTSYRCSLCRIRGGIFTLYELYRFIGCYDVMRFRKGSWLGAATHTHPFLRTQLPDLSLSPCSRFRWEKFLITEKTVKM